MKRPLLALALLLVALPVEAAPSYLGLLPPYAQRRLGDPQTLAIPHQVVEAKAGSWKRMGPARVFEDKKRTYFDFGAEAADTLPEITLVREGVESPAPDLVIDHTHGLMDVGATGDFILRRGKDVVCLIQSNDPGAGLSTGVPRIDSGCVPKPSSQALAVVPAPAVAQAADLPTVAVLERPVPPAVLSEPVAVPVPRWTVHQGQDLHAAAKAWSDQAGYQFVAPPLSAPRWRVSFESSFEGGFEEALAWLMAGFHTQSLRPEVRLYANKVVEIVAEGSR